MTGSERIRRDAVLCTALALGLLSPATAFAHPQGGHALGFASGFLHPLSGVDHVVAMIAVGLWAAQLRGHAIWLLPVTFPIAMTLGGVLALLGVELSGIEVGIALSAAVLGFAVFRESRPPLWLAAVVVGLFAIFHGHAHGTELPAGANGVLYCVGFAVATGLLHATGIATGLVHRYDRGRTALRMAGAAVAMSGAAFLWTAVG